MSAVASGADAKPDVRRARKTYLYDAEYERAVSKARRAGTDYSGLVRMLLDDYEPPAIIDRAQVAELAKVNADLGRLGGLFKAWLVGHPDIRQPLGDMRSAVRGALQAVELTQQEMRALMRTILTTLGRRGR